MNGFFIQDTIAAPATIPGTGAISIIRVSGSETFEVLDKVVTFKKGNINDFAGYSIHFGTICSADGSVLDDVLVSIFRAPHSYTGEDSAEISCHASSYIVSEIMVRLSAAGARMAEPGEFTKRAYVNGKMDLAQAESVADLIASQDQASHRVAMDQLRGGISSELRALRGGLLEMTALMELELDFSEEDVEFADRSKLSALLDEVLAKVSSLADSFRYGNAIRNGVPVTIAGPANSGKSTLLNALLGEDRAIVSDIAGTTRDTIEEMLVVDGVRFRFIDTAGIREGAETIEKIGIERTFRKISEAEIVLGMVDSTDDFETVCESLRSLVSKVDMGRQKLAVLVNKCDLSDGGSGSFGGDSGSFGAAIGNVGAAFGNIGASFGHIGASGTINKNVTNINNFVSSLDDKIVTFNISARDGLGLPELRHWLSGTQKDLLSASQDNVLVTNMRHFEALTSARTSLLRVQQGLALAVPSDLVAQDLREALYHLGSITGEITADEVLGEIFEKFCIGK